MTLRFGNQPLNSATISLAASTPKAIGPTFIADLAFEIQKLGIDSLDFSDGRSLIVPPGRSGVNVSFEYPIPFFSIDNTEEGTSVHVQSEALVVSWQGPYSNSYPGLDSLLGLLGEFQALSEATSGSKWTFDVANLRYTNVLPLEEYSPLKDWINLGMVSPVLEQERPHGANVSWHENGVDFRTIIEFPDGQGIVNLSNIAGTRFEPTDDPSRHIALLRKELNERFLNFLTDKTLEKWKYEPQDA